MTTSTNDTLRPSANNRLPSLNQLAARININVPPTQSPSSSSSTTAPRPRLAAFALRTGSTTSVASSVTTADSVAVNAPTTRSASPSTPPAEEVEVVSPGGEPLTAEKLEKHNQLEGEKKNVKVGYKNIPSLDAITARLAKTRALSIDGSAKPPEAEMIEDPKTPGVPMKAPEHPLQYLWTIYHDTKAKFPYTPASNSQPSTATDGTFSHSTESNDYEAGLTVIGEFNTVKDFFRYFNWLKPPSKLERNSNYHLFKSGIKPMWEDEANANGGKWGIGAGNWLAMALVGEELEEGDEICGAVVSLRSKVDRSQVWTRSKDDIEKLNGIGRKLVKLLDVSEADGIGLEFQYNTDDRPQPNKFLSIQAMPQTGYRKSDLQSPVLSPGAFGSFGVGIGGGSAWRGSKRS
ncbi:translation initiation factor eIF4e [Desarmillaria tabescens]|uniref:Translation initiation factor eIF4e n=1 Tax=Armillaria tabescens TaxID=1929756 RepID=A0AA39JEC5_ARMTA|nr:translation initiation factor eIF4e [Desarmillaria tabescens]KAK0440216.1 translation initiation factor eIF4e [Desarmillaria tabescens]